MVSKVTVDQVFRHAQALARRGNRREAVRLLRQIVDGHPGTSEAGRAQAALEALGPSDPAETVRMLYSSGKFGSVIDTVAGLPAGQRRNATVQILLGGAELAMNRPDRAEAAFRHAVEAAPDRPAAHHNLGLALRAQGKRADARAAFERALALRPGYGDAQNGLALLLQDEGDAAGATEAFAAAAALKPGDPEIWTNLGNMHQAQGRFVDAQAAYLRALAIAPGHANALYNYGLALKSAGRLAEAVDQYRAAIRARPDFAMAHNNLGNTLHALGQLPEAEAALRRAAALAPGNAEIQSNLGYLLQSMGRFDAASHAFAAAVRADPDQAAPEAARFFLRAQMGDWAAHAEFPERAPALGLAGRAVAPFDLLAFEDDPERQMSRAIRYSEEKFGTPAPARHPPAGAKRPHRLRIGYFSADFRGHPVARLIAGTFAAHDRARFELLGYSFGPNPDDPFRRELAARFDRFTDIRALPDAEAVKRIAGDGLDIALDLTLHTQHSRTALFARRIAPVQINYLGFPGTSGASFMDYLIADAHVLPSDAHATEAVIRLPHSYQPNDDRRPRPEDTHTRADHGLPETGLVLASFNSAYKITPREFDIWMRVLGARPGAVLWLLESTHWAAENLRRAAERHGIDPARLVFAPRLPNDAHLARHRHADLFLDTFAYNAHTTGSDALWMGLPVVTLAGRQFAARVCASLLHAAGLPELIAETEADYEALILRLAGDRAALAALRSRLEDASATAPLFDTAGHTRALEAAYDAVHARWRDGRPPAPLTISPALEAAWT